MGNKGSSENNGNPSYTWKIPFYTKNQTYCLVAGYIHQYERDPTNNCKPSIPIDIIGIFVAFFDDDYELDNIKNAKPGDSFKSNIFGVDKFKFEMEICPNGEGTQSNYIDIGQFTLFINLLSIPPQIEQLCLKYDTSFFELDIKNSDELTFSRTITSYRWSERLKIDKIQHLNTFTFQIDIKGIKLFYINTNDSDVDSEDTKTEITEPKTEIINIKDINILDKLSLPQGHYTWKIYDSDDIKNFEKLQKDEFVESKLFEVASLKWKMKLYKMENNTCNYCVYIVSLSPKIYTLFVSYKISFIEKDLSQNGCIEFKDNAITFWPSKLSNIENISHLQTITIKMEITVLDAFDKHNNTINDIYKLHSPSLLTKTGRFVWKITDDKLLNQIKNATENTKFMSDAFEYNKCKYCLSLFPCGYNIEKGNENSENNVALMLNLLSPPSDVVTMTLCFELKLHETNNTGVNYAQFLCESFWGWQQPIRQKLKDLNTLTLEAIITVIDVFDEHGVSINDKYITHDENDEYNRTKITKGFLGKYRWEITDEDTINRIQCAEEGNVFISKVFEIFNSKFVIEFYPIAMKTECMTEEIAALYISMLSMPKQVHSMSFGYKLSLKETNTQDTNFVQFHDTSISIGWTRHIAPSTNIVKSLNKYTFEVELNLLDIYDKHGNLIIDQFIDLDDEKSQQITQYGREINVELGEYEWIISDPAMIKKMRKSGHSEFFRSELFSIQGFKFFMQCTPNGANPTDIGNFGCFLYIASLPPNIWKLTLYYELLLVETNTIDCYATAASQKRTTCGWFRNLKFSEIKHMNKFTFRLKVGVIDIFDKDGNIVSINQNIQQKVCSNLTLTACDKYVWKIKNKQLIKNIKTAKHMQYFDSPLFGCREFKWSVRFTPNGQNNKTKGESTLGVKLDRLPNGIDGVSIFFELFLKETETKWTYCSHFREDYLHQSWQTCRIKFSDLQSLKHFTIYCKILLIDIYYQSSK